MKPITSLVVLCLFCFALQSYASEQSYQRTLNWQELQAVPTSSGEVFYLMGFSGAENLFENNYRPEFYEVFPLSLAATGVQAKIKDMIFEPVSPDDAKKLTWLEQIGFDIALESGIAFDRKNPVAVIKFTPVRKNRLTGQYERLTHFSILLIESEDPTASFVHKSQTYAENSVLAAGDWYKIAVTNTGVHKLTYQNLLDLGIPVNNINPKHIRIYGNGGGMLPENSNHFRHDDLQENSIFVYGEEDGSFDQEDYILFYGQSPDLLQYSPESGILRKKIHLYSDHTYYFITADLGPGKRISIQYSSELPPNKYITDFHNAIHHELEEVNLIRSGRKWYGEVFDLNTTLVKEYTLPNLVPGSSLILSVTAAARSDASSNFEIFVNNDKKIHLPILSTNSSNPNSDYAKERSDTAHFNISGTNLSIKVAFNKALSASVGWLDFFNINYLQDLSFNGGQLNFRNLTTAQAEWVSEYRLSKANQGVTIWNVSNPLEVKRVDAALTNTELRFVLASESLQEFIAFDGTSFFTPQGLGKIPNQNLHGLGAFEMVILTHSDFTDQANRLAEHHASYDDMSVLVIEPQYVYNEFSSGAQDITALRDFMKMLYDKASPGNEPKYLLLFGGASYDYKNRIANNTNYIPTWQSIQSLNPISSFINDDFYGLLDGPTDMMIDIGVGRFVVNTHAQAKTVVDKTIHYAVNADQVMGDWRNVICLIADDEDLNLHFLQAEELADTIGKVKPEINIDKIYLDAYNQVSTPSGSRYPDVTRDLTNRVNRGALLIHYIGHGGEGGLAHERILSTSDIQGWNNLNNMPVFLTATCDFSPFDNPARLSAGEMIALSPKGAAVALFSTTRATYAGANMQLSKNFYKYALIRPSGAYLRMGDILRSAKNATGNIENKSKFSLLGDPAMRFAFPGHQVLLTKITDIDKQEIDTIQALLKVTITGIIQDYDGNKLNGYNGILFPTVYDKPTKMTTLGNDPGSYPAIFYHQKNILYKGKAQIVDGEWSFSFIAPKDLAYQYGYGKISFYAKDESTDGTGFYDQVVIGGYNQFAERDEKGPVIDLFMNDTDFSFGGLTDENPKMLAFVYDESGINTVGTGIGHDITVTLNGERTFVINDFYEAGMNDYKNGIITYPFYNLENGRHNLTLKLWD
ncbi:MAG: type IX secretion system sortase PorU, partial [Bacteroidales bacterium]